MLSKKKYNGHKARRKIMLLKKEIQRPQALNFKDHALVEYNGLKPLNRIKKPMLYTLSSQSTRPMSDTLASSF